MLCCCPTVLVWLSCFSVFCTDDAITGVSQIIASTGRGSAAPRPSRRLKTTISEAGVAHQVSHSLVTDVQLFSWCQLRFKQSFRKDAHNVMHVMHTNAVAMATPRNRGDVQYDIIIYLVVPADGTPKPDETEGTAVPHYSFRH